MVKIISVCSGKGGVGKTVVSSNIAMSLRKLRKKVVIIDFNFTTPHLGLYFGLYSHAITLNSFLRGETGLEETVYDHPTGLGIIPASLDMVDLVNVDTEGLKEKIKDVFWDYDFVIIDSAPGLGKEALISLKTCDEIIFVANPQIPSLVDVVKCVKVVNQIVPRPSVLGLIVNKVRGKGFETSLEEIKEFTELSVLGIVREDNSILEAENKKTILTAHKERSKTSRVFFKIASKISGVQYYQPGFFDNIRDSLFKSKKEFL